jgi:hypothetical protein
LPPDDFEKPPLLRGEDEGEDGFEKPPEVRDGDGDAEDGLLLPLNPPVDRGDEAGLLLKPPVDRDGDGAADGDEDGLKPPVDRGDGVVGWDENPPDVRAGVTAVGGR